MFATIVYMLCMSVPVARSHDIPNQRIDRSIQATVSPGLLRLEYEVSLSELTLTQDLRNLVGTLPGAERSVWLERYGEVTGPLNAKGFLVTCNGQPVSLDVRRFDVVVEEHPRYTFHFEGRIPDQGRLSIQDTNYASSEGTSRLAIRGQSGVTISGDDLSGDVDQIPIRPVWQLTDEEERRTKRVEVTFRGPAPGLIPDQSARGQAEKQERPDQSEPSRRSRIEPKRGPSTISTRGDGLSRLLDRRWGEAWPFLLLIAAGLGAIHAIQPGHGKTLVSAVALGPEARWYQPALLGLVATLAHTGSVLLVAAGLWWTGASRVAPLHQTLTQTAGFAIAAGGFWRLGRYWGGLSDHPDAPGFSPARGLSTWELVGLGLAGGLVPCWDAVGLVVLSAALGRLGVGVVLVLAFGAGMAAVLVSVGWLASRLKSATLSAERSRTWESVLGLASGAILAAIGLFFFLG